MNAAILLFPGVEEMDAFAPYEVLSAAAYLGGDIQVQLLSAEGGTITAFHGMQIGGSMQIDQNSFYDLIVVPGGAWLAGGATGVRLAIDEKFLGPWIKKQSEAGSIIASVCTGAFLLADSGLLTNRRATTHHSSFHLLKDYGAIPIKERIVDEGNIITAGGVTSGIDLSLWIIERFLGKELAEKTRDYLEYQRRE